MKRIILRGSLFIYLLIGLEILIMISPFAVYFYSFYSPLLSLVYASRFTSWLAEFFLPHFVFIDDLFLKAIGAVQLTAFLGGMALFFYAAIPLYYSKFTGRGVVTRGLYRKVRHPQYLGLGIAGFGLLLYWPRFFILLLYLTMLFIYYLLARNEEQRMINQYSESYRAYLSAVPMFLPGEIGGRAFRFVFRTGGGKGIVLAGFYGLALLLGIFAALLLRQYSVSHIRLGEIGGISELPVLPRHDALDRTIVGGVVADERVRSKIAQEGATLAYVMPSDYFLMALVTDLDRLYPPELEKPAGGPTVPRFFRIFLTYSKMQLGIYPEPHSLTRIIFVAVKDAAGMPLKGREVFDLGAKRYAVFHVDYDSSSREIVSIQDLEPRHKWGEIPMPVF